MITKVSTNIKLGLRCVRYDKTLNIATAEETSAIHIMPIVVEEPSRIEEMLIQGEKVSMESVLLQDKDVYYNGNKKHSKTVAL